MINIAICDDNKAMLDYLSREIGECFQEALVNTKISSFDSGKAFVLSHRSTPFDVVFLDIVMPVKDGIAAVKEIRESDPKAVIIIVSSVGTQAQLKNAIEAGAKDFIQKPLNVEQIERVLKNYFEGR